jgi:hypothetical protein
MCGFRLKSCLSGYEKNFLARWRRAFAGKPDSLLPLLRRGKMPIFKPTTNLSRSDKTGYPAQILLLLRNFSSSPMLAHDGWQHFMALEAPV